MSDETDDIHHHPTVPPPNIPHGPYPDTHPPAQHPTKDPSSAPATKPMRYQWIGSDNTSEYMESIRKWQAHSNQANFIEQFNTITREY